MNLLAQRWTHDTYFNGMPKIVGPLSLSASPFSGTVNVKPGDGDMPGKSDGLWPLSVREMFECDRTIG